MGPFPHPLLPKTVQLLLPPCVVKSTHKLLSRSLSYFPLGPMATITRFPCWLGREGRTWDGWQKTSATLTKGGMPVAELWLLSHPSVGGVGARIQSVHHHTNSDGHASRPVGICLGLCIVHLPQPLLQRLQLLGRQCPWPQFFLRSCSGVVQGRPIIPWVGVAHQIELRFSLNSTLVNPFAVRYLVT